MSLLVPDCVMVYKLETAWGQEIVVAESFRAAMNWLVTRLDIGRISGFSEMENAAFAVTTKGWTVMAERL